MPGGAASTIGSRELGDRPRTCRCRRALYPSEAEFARHYQMDAVFVDRMNFMGINANPARAGLGERLALVPSSAPGSDRAHPAAHVLATPVNPQLAVGLNNTTQWAGVRYSDFTLLEGGDALRDYSLPWLMHPHGLVNLRHFPVIFGDVADSNLFQVIGDTDASPGFLATMRLFIRRSLVSGVIAEPYGDEDFRQPSRSVFFQEGRDKDQPDAAKAALLAAIPYYGGAGMARVLGRRCPCAGRRAARHRTGGQRLAQPADGPFVFPHRFLARQGDTGGWYIGLLNESEQAQQVEFHLRGMQLAAQYRAGGTRVVAGRRRGMADPRV